MFTMPRKGIVNVKMVITEEKILSNIEKVHRIINPDSKKQIIELDDNSYFKDLIESIKTYLIEYPKKKNFPKSVYDAAFSLVEYATEQFDSNTKKVESLIKQREINTKLGAILKQTLAIIQTPNSEWQKAIINVQNRYPIEIINALNAVGYENGKAEKSAKYKEAVKVINARISNLETNLHIEIDLERIEDKSKALSYIGIEIADALKTIPTPRDSESFETIAQTENTEIKAETIEEVVEPAIEAIAESVIEEQPVQQIIEQPVQEVEEKPVQVEQPVQEVQTVAPRRITAADIAEAQRELMAEEMKRRQQAMQQTAQPVQTVVEKPVVERPVQVAQQPMPQYVQPQIRYNQQLNVPRYGQVINQQRQYAAQMQAQQRRQQVMQQAVRQPIQQEQRTQQNVVAQTVQQKEVAQSSIYANHVEETTKEVKPSLWQRFKKTKFAKAFSYLFKVRVVLQLPEGQEDQSR